jgi:hypothetical protein
MELCLILNWLNELLDQDPFRNDDQYKNKNIVYILIYIPHQKWMQPLVQIHFSILSIFNVLC